MIIYCIAVFFVAVLVFSGIMNGGNTDMTMEMSEATLPVVSFRYGGYEFNRMYGYTSDMNVSLMRDGITPLSDGRKLSFKIDTYGNQITKISYELRTTDGERLIENNDVYNYVQGGNAVTGDIQFKDLIYKDTEYSLTILIDTDKTQRIKYYAKIIDMGEINLLDKLKFAYDFSDTSFDKVKAQSELPTYLESNAKGDNSSFAYVDIHSSLNQITWGALNPSRVEDPVATIKTIDNGNAEIELDYFIKTSDSSRDVFYRVNEMYKIKEGSERMFLLDYRRNMSELFSSTTGILANNKIVLGVTDSDIKKIESPDGNRLAFVNDGRLYTYNITDNKMAYVYGYYEDDVTDARNTNNNHEIKIFNVDETGNVYFLVYGYMNRGVHEGEMGGVVYYYDSILNTVEELLYIKMDDSYDLVKESMETMAFVNSHSQFFYINNGDLYRINLKSENETVVASNLYKGNYVVNSDESVIAWVDEGGVMYGQRIIIYDMEGTKQTYVNANENTCIKPIGFFGDDLIYGEAYEKDIAKTLNDKMLFPMYKIVIRNSNSILKEYEEPGQYVVDYELDDKMLNLTKASSIYKDGSYTDISYDQILNNTGAATYKNTIETAVTERYETIVQLVLRKDIDSKTLQVLTPKQVILENNKNYELVQDRNGMDIFYVYLSGNYDSSYLNLTDAVKKAYENNGLVAGKDGRIIYQKKTRINKNQIMAITGTGLENDDNEDDTVAVCLNTILEYEGVNKDTRSLIEEGESPEDILSDNLVNKMVINLTDAPLDVVLNYVEKDIPVLAYTGDDTAVLIVGYNEYNTVLMDPKTGTVYKYGINDSTEMFEKNGNRFITYLSFDD